MYVLFLKQKREASVIEYYVDGVLRIKWARETRDAELEMLLS